MGRASSKTKQETKEIKLLLLGPMESGKSTFAKQIRMLCQGEYSEEGRNNYKSLVYANLYQSMVAVLDGMEFLNIKYKDSKLMLRYEGTFRTAAKHMEAIDLTGRIGKALRVLWADEGVQESYARSCEYQLNDSATYFLENMGTIFDSAYTPSTQDVLQTRVKTTGIKETKYKYNSLAFSLVDVGGHLSERRKWTECVEKVTALIFCVNLSSYDQVLPGSERKNAMQESLTLFSTVCDDLVHSEAIIILFLNKKDLFQNKISTYPLKICFSEYSGENEYEPASQFVKDRFEKQNKQGDTREMYTHFTCATDVQNVRFVFDAVLHVLTKKNCDSRFLQ